MSIKYIRQIVGYCIVLFTIAFGTTCLSFFVAPVVSEFGWAVSAFTLHISLLSVSGIFGILVWGKLMPKCGARMMIIIDGIITGLCFMAFSLCGSLVSFYVVSLVIGFSFIAGNSFACIQMINTWFLKSKGMINGICFAFSGVSGAICGLFLPNLIESRGWRIGYIILGVMEIVLTLFAAIVLLRNKPEDLGVSAYGYGEDGQAGKTNLELVKEQKTGFTLNGAMKHWQFWVFSLGLVCMNACSAASSHVSNNFVSNGMTTVQAGYLVSIMMVGNVVWKLAEGIMVDRIGVRKTVVICSIGEVIAFILMAVAHNFVLCAVAVFMLSMGFALINAAEPMIVGYAYGRKHYNELWSAAQTCNYVGYVAAVPLIGLALDVTGSYAPAMYICAIFAGVSMICLYFAGGALKKKREDTFAAEIREIEMAN